MNRENQIDRFGREQYERGVAEGKAQRDQLLSAAKELIAQTDLIHYTGPFIGPRLAALRAAIDAVESKEQVA